jgi:hypothetical protein
VSGPADPRQLAVPFVRHSDTSRAAAEAIEDRAPGKQARVLACLLLRGLEGATDEEVQDLLRMSPNTERPRRIELVRMGLCRDAGRSRRTRAGRMATVWVATGRAP